MERTGEQRRREGDMSGRTKKIGQEGMEEVKSLGYIPLKLAYSIRGLGAFASLQLVSRKRVRKLTGD